MNRQSDAVNASWGQAERATDAYEDFSNKVTGAKAAYENFADVAKDSESTPDDLNLAWSELSSQLGKGAEAGNVLSGVFGGVRSTAEDAAEGLRDADKSVGDVVDDTIKSIGPSFLGGALSGWSGILDGLGGGITDVGGDVDALGEAFGQVSETVSGVVTPVFGAALPAAIGGGVTALLGSLPALAAVGGGFLSFGALAFPALDKVKDGLTNVTSAQQAYQQAVGVEKRDPTTANLEAQQKALATLQTTWANMPRGVSGAVSAVQQFGHAWSEVSQKSGIQQDFLGDIPKALGAVEKALPCC